MLARSSRRLPLALLGPLACPLLLGLIGCAPVYRIGQRPAPSPALTLPLMSPLTPAPAPAQLSQPLTPRLPAPLTSFVRG